MINFMHLKSSVREESCINDEAKKCRCGSKQRRSTEETGASASKVYFLFFVQIQETCGIRDDLRNQNPNTRLDSQDKNPFGLINDQNFHHLEKRGKERVSSFLSLPSRIIFREENNYKKTPGLITMFAVQSNRSRKPKSRFHFPGSLLARNSFSLWSHTEDEASCFI